MPIHLRPSFWAAWIAVPQPQNGSSTTSPGLLLALMMRSRRATGFAWGSRDIPTVPCRCSISSQRSVMVAPAFHPDTALVTGNTSRLCLSAIRPSSYAARIRFSVHLQTVTPRNS